VFCAGDQIIMADSEVNLERGVIKLQYAAKLLEWKYHQKNLRRWHF